MVEHAALVGLLVSKGIFTNEEYADALIEGMQREVDSYEKKLSDRMGAKIVLG